MGATGTASVDFGAFPGKTDVSLAIIGQAGILAGSYVEAWIFPAATADHSADEHWVDPPDVIAGNVAAGTGFTIYAINKTRAEAGPTGDSTRVRNIDGPMIYGVWNVAWVWN